MKKIMFFLISMVMIICLSSDTKITKAEISPEKKRFTVIVLDVSDEASFYLDGEEIYKAPSAISYVKSASKRFVENIRTSKDDNYIAVVTYKDVAEVVYDFSKNYDEINDAIDGLYESGTGRDISLGLQLALSLLNKIDDVDVEKNIVLVTTGMTNIGNHSTQGVYDSSTIGSDWFRADTGVYLYEYANYAYEIASNIKNSGITLYTVGLFQSMKDMPEMGKSIAEFFRLTASDLATSEECYFPVDNPDELDLTFGEVADRISEITTIKGILGDYTLAVVIDGDDGFLYDIQIDGKTYKLARDVISQERADFYKGCEVKAVISDDEIISIIPHMTLFRDNNGFSHTSDTFFLPNENQTYLISDERFKDLLTWYYEYNTNINGLDIYKLEHPFKSLFGFGKNLLQKMRDNDWDGSCFGIAASSAAVYDGIVDLYAATSIKGTYYAISNLGPARTNGLRDLINYYQLSQYINCFGNYEVDADGYMEEMHQQQMNDRIKEIIKCANECEATGEPFILTMMYEHDKVDKYGELVYDDNGELLRTTGGHSVVGVGIEDNRDGTFFRIRIIDPNTRAEYEYMNIFYNPETQNYSVSFDVEYNTRLNYEFFYFGLVKACELIDYDGGANNRSFSENAVHLIFDSNEKVTVVDKDTGKRFVYNSGETDGSVSVLKKYYYSGGDYDDGSQVGYDLEKGSKYQIITDGAIDICIGTDEVFYGCDVTGAETIDVDFDAGINLSGEKIDYNIYLSMNDKADLINIEGQSDGYLNIKKNIDGTVDFSGNDNVIAQTKIFNNDKVTENSTFVNADMVKIDVAGEDVMLSTTSIENFVSRLYRNLLGREPEAAGLKAWTDALVNNKTTGAKIVYKFVYSDEFQENPLSNNVFVNALYETILGREADEAGLTAWVNVLENGCTRKKVLAGFLNSEEMRVLCESIGIEAGSYYSDEIVDKNTKVTYFVSRMYRCCLGREADYAGLTSWVSALLDGRATGTKIAYGFFFSDEMKNMGLSNRDYVANAYVALLDRQPDANGLKAWTDALDIGTERKKIVNCFVSSQEFGNLCAEYGITR